MTDKQGRVAEDVRLDKTGIRECLLSENPDGSVSVAQNRSCALSPCPSESPLSSAKLHLLDRPQL